jgi:F420-non-reducing hydrogenase iron-sulfur subunit
LLARVKTAKKRTVKKTAKSKTSTTRRTKAGPRIVVFTCSWYPAIAADNAGVLGCEYPADTRIVTLECAGSLTPSLILDAFGAGAGGVLVGACKPELCHFVNGSSTCERVVSETKELAELLGIGAERIQLETFDSEDGELFANYVKEFWTKTGRLGPFAVDR